MKLSEKKIISMIRFKYKRRLAEVAIRVSLEETEVYDDRGNMLLAKDLKVRHKASGYEYTVDHVEGEGEDAVIYLRHPDQPRFIPGASEQPLQEKTSVNLKGLNFDNMTGGRELDIAVPETIDLDQNELRTKDPSALLPVKKKEFEEEYEVL